MEKFWNEQQSICYENTMTDGDIVLKCKIKRNSYDFQSSLKVLALDTQSLAWNTIDSLPIELCECKAINAYQKVSEKNIIKLFRDDSEKALSRMLELIKTARKQNHEKVQ